MAIGTMPAKKMTRRETEQVCAFDVRANVFSLGGVMLLAVCIVLTMFFFLVLFSSEATPAQRVMTFVLTVGAWFYCLSSATERLALMDHAVVYSTAISKERHIPLEELQEMLLVHQGFNLERGIVTIEFRRKKKDAERIALGPCWRRHQLEGFLHSVEEALNAPELLEEVR